MTSDSEKAAPSGQQAADAQVVPEAPVAEASKPPPADEAKVSVTPAAAAPAEPTVEQKLAEAMAESARLRDQLLRTAADFDNFRKRSRRAEDDAQKRGRETLLKEVLPVFDNLERAIVHAESAPDVKAVSEGLRMVQKQFIDTLERSGIKRIAAVGQSFDPTRHEAIQHLESAQYPAGVVMAEVQPGYVMGEQLVRAAMVVVSKGAPAAAEAAS